MTEEQIDYLQLVYEDLSIQMNELYRRRENVAKLLWPENYEFLSQESKGFQPEMGCDL